MPIESGVFVFPKGAGGALAGRVVSDHQIPLNLLVNFASSPMVMERHPEEADLVWVEVLSRCERLGITPPDRIPGAPSRPDPMPTTAAPRVVAVQAPVQTAKPDGGLLMPCGHPVSDLRAMDGNGSRRSVCHGCDRLNRLISSLHVGSVMGDTKDAARATLLAWEQDVRGLA